jgi:hypothetical protein
MASTICRPSSDHASIATPETSVLVATMVPAIQAQTM